MINNLDAWAQELREACYCLSWFTLKVKALEILRKLGMTLSGYGNKKLFLAVAFAKNKKS
jgi:hypothetical protein